MTYKAVNVFIYFKNYIKVVDDIKIYLIYIYFKFPIIASNEDQCKIMVV